MQIMRGAQNRSERNSRKQRFQTETPRGLRRRKSQQFDVTKPFGETPGPAKRHRRCNMGSQVRQSLEVKQLNCGDCRRRIQGPLPTVSEKEHGKLSRREQAESNRQAVNRQSANGSVWLHFERRSTGLLRKRWFSEAIRGPEFSRRSTALQ